MTGNPWIEVARLAVAIIGGGGLAWFLSFAREKRAEIDDAERQAVRRALMVRESAKEVADLLLSAGLIERAHDVERRGNEQAAEIMVRPGVRAESWQFRDYPVWVINSVLVTAGFLIYLVMFVDRLSDPAFFGALAFLGIPAALSLGFIHRVDKRLEARINEEARCLPFHPKHVRPTRPDRG